MEVVNTRSPSGATVQFKDRLVLATNGVSIPTPFTKEVTASLAGADPGDLIECSPAQALAAGVFLGGARVTAAGIIGITLGTTGGTTVTLNASVTLDVYVTKGGTDI